MLLVAAVILAAVAAGVGAERRWADRARLASQRGLDVLVYVVMPIVIFFTVSHVELTAGVGAGIAFGWLERILVALLAWALCVHVLHLTRRQTGAVMVCACIANTGYLGVPIIVALIGGDAVGEALTYDVAVNVPAMMLLGFGIGAAFGSNVGAGGRDRLRAFLLRNPPLYAFVLALAAPAAISPDWARDAAQVLALAVAPLGFFAVGVYLMQEQEHGVRVFPPPLTAPIGVVLGLRLLLAPALMLTLSALIVSVPEAFRVESAMAVGVTPLGIAHIYGLDLKIVAGSIAWSTTIVLIAGAAAAIFGWL